MDTLLIFLIFGIPVLVVCTATLAKYQREKLRNTRGEMIFGKLGCLFSLIWIVALVLKIVNPGFVSGVSTLSEDGSSSSVTKYSDYKWSEDAKHLSNNRVNKWVNLKVLDVDLQAEKAYIDPLFWSNIDYKEKDELVKTILIYTEVEKSKNISSFDFYDKRSGKKIAEWTKLLGVEIL